MANTGGVKIEGLKEFRKALRDADRNAPREMTKALKRAGQFLQPRIKANTPRNRTGGLAAAVRSARASGTRGHIPVHHRAAAIAEFSNKGRYGATMNARYGPTPRYGYRTLEDNVDKVEDQLYKELRQIATIYGWARE